MNNTINIFKYGTVISVNDELDGDRIKVQILGEDPQELTDKNIKEIPYAFPLLPKTFHVKPKIGEKVLIFSQNGNFKDDRFYIGPLISQQNKIDGDPFSGLAFLRSSLVSPGTPPSQDRDNVGVQMGKDDVGLNGRGTTDVIVKPNEIRIRAGATLDLKKLNKTNPSYIQVKFDKAKKESDINIVSDRINLLTYGGSKDFNMVDPNDLINSKEYQKILETAHKLPYGDVLVDFLKLFIKAFSVHVHPYHGMSPDLTQIELKNLLSYELSKIIAKNIRIN